MRKPLTGLATRLSIGLLLAVTMLLAVVGVTSAQSASTLESDPAQSLLPVEQAFKLSAHVSEPGVIALHWDIAPDYYLYRSRIKSRTSQAGLTLGELALPAGEKSHDEFLGDVETYHHPIDATLAYTLTDVAATTAAVIITAQGCHEIDPKICYPPHPTLLTLAVPAAIAPTAAATDAASAAKNITSDATSTGLSAVVPLALKLGSDAALVDAQASAPLPPEQAFVFEAIAQSPTEILARWTMPKGYYLYRDKSSVQLADSAGVSLGKPQWPQGVSHSDEHFGTVAVYFDQVELPIPLHRERGDAQTIKVHAEYQGCKENGICYPVMQHDVAVTLPPASAQQLNVANAAFMANPATTAPTPDDGNASRRVSATPNRAGILGALLLALLGGLVLNLMPCVLPVLALKVLGIVQGGESRAQARRHALYYSAGVLVAFAAVGFAVVGLRAAGHALGWGFQLQQPVFVAVLVYVLFAIGLSLSGVFSIGAGLAGIGQNLGNRSGPAGDFFTGVLAVVVASPCTAPFMGSALVYAFAASSLLALLVFLALGLGLALPFLLIGFVPALAARLPKPGAWMETLKQLLAFPMYLTAVWLVWVLGNQRGIDAVGWVLIGAVVLALGLWWWGHGRYRGAPASRAFAVVVMLVALLPLAQITHMPMPARAATATAHDWVPYSATRLAALRAERRSVLVDMGADWCVTCKVNEKAVLDTDAFRDLLKRSNAVLMRGDWTNVDPAITAFLQQYQAVGVPLYVVFRGDQPEGPGHALPTVLTQGIVEAALAPLAH